MEDIKTLWLMVTNEPLLGILSFIIVGLLIQAAISGIVLANRKQILMDEYGYNEQQIYGFYWKSVLLFPITWSIFVIRGTKAIWGAIKGFFINLWILIKRIAES